jgi:hypothetical protein
MVIYEYTLSKYKILFENQQIYQIKLSRDIQDFCEIYI